MKWQLFKLDALNETSFQVAKHDDLKRFTNPLNRTVVRETKRPITNFPTLNI